MQNAKNIEDAELFILKHGENIVDTLGAEVDRIEDSLMVRLFTVIVESLMVRLFYCYS